MMEKSSKNRWLSLCLGSLIAIAIAELGCRLFPTWHDAFVLDIVNSQLPAELYVPVGGFIPGERPQKVRFRHQANQQALFQGLEYRNWVYTDANGFRIGQEALPKSEKSVLLLGDSFLFAGQVSWENSIAGLLNKHHPEIQWLNAGVDGYSTQDALTLWQEVSIQPEPTEVWLFFFWGNDIWENDWENRSILTPNEDLETAWDGQSKTMRWLSKSRFFSRLYALYAIQSDERFQEKRQQMNLLEDIQLLEQAMVSSQNQFKQLAARCDEIVCRVLLIPPAEAFRDSGLAETVIPVLKKNIPEIIHTVDLFPTLQQSGGTQLYFHSDPHWNPAGHASVFDYLDSTIDLRQTIDQ